MSLRVGHLSEGAEVRLRQDVPINRLRSLPAGVTGRIELIAFHPSSWQIELHLLPESGSRLELWFDAGDGEQAAAQRLREQFEVLQDLDGTSTDTRFVCPASGSPASQSAPDAAPLPPRVDRIFLGDLLRLRQPLTDSIGSTVPAGYTGRVCRLEASGPDSPVVMELLPDRGKPLSLRFARSWFGDQGHARLRQYFELAHAGRFRQPATRSPLRRLLKRLTGGSNTAAAAPPSPLDRELPLEAHLDYLLDLAAAGEYGRAEAHWKAVDEAQAMNGGADIDHDRSLAERYGRLALRLVERNGRIGDPTIWSWLTDAARRHWYGWGAQATSGGEGSERGRQIRAAELAFEGAEARHRRIVDR